MRYLHFTRYLLPLLLLIPALTPVRAQGATDADKQYAIALQDYRVGDYVAAAKEFDTFVNSYPADPRLALAYSYLGSSYQLQDKPDLLEKAMAAFAQALAQASPGKQSRTRAEAYFHLGDCYNKEKKYSEATGCYKQALGELGTPPSADDLDLAIRAQYWMAENEYLGGKLDVALTDYQQVPTMGPKHALAPWALYSVGMIQLQQQQYNSAITTLEPVLTIYKDSDVTNDATLALGYAYAGRAGARPDTEASARDTDRKRAIDLFTTVANDKNSPDSLRQQADTAIGQTEFDLGEYGKSEAGFAQALKLVKDQTSQQAVDLNFWRGHALYNAARYKEAADAYGVVIASAAASPSRVQEALYWCGQSNYLLAKRANGGVGAYTAAITTFQRYLTVAGDKDQRASAVALLIAFCEEDLASLNQPNARTDAMAAFKTVLDKWPNAPEASQASAGIVRLTATAMDIPELEKWNAQNLPGMAGWSVALQLSRKYFLASRYDDALKTAQKVLVATPTADITSQAAYLAGASQQKQNHPQDALVYYRQALDAKPSDDLLNLTQRGLVQCYLDTKQYAQARDMALTLTKQPNPDPNLAAENLMYLAEAYLNTGVKADALTTYQKVVSDYPKSSLVPNALQAIGWIAEDAQQPDHVLAVDTYTKLITQFKATRPDLMPEANFRLGINQADLKHYDEAIVAFQQVPDTDKLADQAWYGIAWAYSDNGQPDKANAQFQKLADKFPDSPLAADSLYRIGDYWFKQGKYSVAAPYLKSAYQKAKPDSNMLSTFAYKYGQAAYYTDLFADGVVAFGVAANDPAFEANAEALFWQAVCQEKLATVDDSKAARMTYLQYVDKYSKGDRIADAALGAGRAGLVAKMPAAARDDLQKCLTMTGNPEIVKIIGPKRADEVGAEAQYWLGQSYYDEGNYADAHRQYAAVSAFNYEPWYSRSLLMMAKCSMATKEPDKATNTLKLLVNIFPTDHPTVKEALQYAKDNGLDVQPKAGAGTPTTGGTAIPGTTTTPTPTTGSPTPEHP